MSDTDKYEGHTEEEWHRDSNDLWFHRDGKDIGIADILIRGDVDERYYEDVANARLIADAPKLLAEVKRLYKVMDVLKDFHLVKNVEQGFTQREWVELVELVKRGEEE